jgi:primase-polymerase (primpol)-like protein
MTTDPTIPDGRYDIEIAHPLEDFPCWSGHRGKRPIDVHTGAYGDATNAGHFDHVQVALECIRRDRLDGLSLRLGRYGDIYIVGFDFDHVFVNGRLRPEVRAVLKLLDTYSERSLSRSGFHAYGLSRIDFGGRRSGGNEGYSSGRQFVYTGDRLDDSPATLRDVTHDLPAVWRLLFGEDVPGREHVTGDPAAWSEVDTPTVALMTKAVRGGLHGWDRVLLDRTDAAGYASLSEADYVLALACLRAGLTPAEAFTLCQRSLRGQAAVARKGKRRLPYWQVTVQRAAAMLRQEGTLLTTPTPRPAWLGQGRRGGR